MGLLDRIALDPQVRFGKPCVRGTRTSVGDVLGYLAGGMTRTRSCGTSHSSCGTTSAPASCTRPSASAEPSACLRPEDTAHCPGITYPPIGDLRAGTVKARRPRACAGGAKRRALHGAEHRSRIARVMADALAKGHERFTVGRRTRPRLVPDVGQVFLDPLAAARLADRTVLRSFTTPTPRAETLTRTSTAMA